MKPRPGAALDRTVGDVRVRWVTGLNTINFTSIVLTNSSGSGMSGLTNLNLHAGLDGLHATGQFANLPASIKISQCVTFDKCTMIWDNTGACCGPNKQFSFDVKLACDPSTHNLDDMGLSNVVIDKFEITESIAGIDLPSQDITDPVHSAVVGQLTKYLTQPFISHDGKQLTLVQYLNLVGHDYIAQLC